LRLAYLKCQIFGQNRSSGAGILATSLFLYGESEKTGRDELSTPEISANVNFAVFKYVIQIRSEQGLFKGIRFERKKQLIIRF
jgi:hypothetical protein